jgi:hypothetical protein
MADEFSESVKRVLASRAANTCSNPECRAPTSGPQDDPDKAVNVGVAAHITARSPGGPRYDPGLLPEERSAPSNGIWLCQNCAKYVDNDEARFSVEVLKKWKADAEERAKARVGKTAAVIGSNPIYLAKYARVRITPIVPRVHEQSEFILMEDSNESFVFQKTDSQSYVDIPKTFIERIHKVGDSKPALIQLSGRLQWVSLKRNFELFLPSGPLDAYGIGKDIDTRYASQLGIECKFARQDRLPELLGRGWNVFYDSDGMYLRWPGRDMNQVLVCDWV